MNSGIYTITNLVNNKMYVGYATKFSDRKSQHFGELRSGVHKNTHLQKSFNKYGEENFIFEILEKCEGEFLVAMEHYWCNVLNVHNKNYGFNKKLTHPFKINYRHTKDSLIKMSKAKKGKPSPNKGRTGSWGIKKPVLQYDLTGKFIKEWEGVIAAAIGLGKPRKQATCISLSCQRFSRSGFGYFWRYKISSNFSKNIVIYEKYKPLIQAEDKEGNISYYRDSMTASEITGVNYSKIRACLIGDRKTAGKLKWAYKETVDDFYPTEEINFENFNLEDEQDSGVIINGNVGGSADSQSSDMG